MTLQKKKNEALHLRNKFLFISIWVIGYVLIWGIMFSLYEMIALNLGINLELSISFILGILTSLLQYILIWWMFGRNLKWWLFWSVIAWLLPPFLGFYLEPETLFNLIAFLLLLYMPSTLVQVLLLRNYVRHSWIWSLANIIGILIFATFIAFANADMIIILLGLAFYAIVIALTLIWLFRTPNYDMRKKI